jgi:transposase
MPLLRLYTGLKSLCENRVDASFILHEEGDAMAKFLEYNPERAYLLPPSVRDVLGAGHLCFFVRGVVARLDLQAFRSEYAEAGGPAYAPEMLVAVWLYAYALGVTSSRRLEQRIREDLAFRYLAGGAAPDHWTLNAFRRRHGRGLNDLFTRVVELARASGLGRLGHVAIDSTRIAANASRNRLNTEQALRGRAFGGTFAVGSGNVLPTRRTKARAAKWVRK